MKNLFVFLFCFVGLLPLQAQFSTIFNAGLNGEVIYEVEVSDCSANNGLFAAIRYSNLSGNDNDEIIVGTFDRTTGVVNSPSFVYPNPTTPAPLTSVSIDENIEMERLVDANNNCVGYAIVATIRDAPGGDSNPHIIRVDPAGDFVSATVLYENNGSSELFNEIFQDQDLQLVMAGGIANAQGTDILVAKFNILTSIGLNDRKYSIDTNGLVLIEYSGQNTAPPMKLAVYPFGNTPN